MEEREPLGGSEPQIGDDGAGGVAETAPARRSSWEEPVTAQQPPTEELGRAGQQPAPGEQPPRPEQPFGAAPFGWPYGQGGHGQPGYGHGGYGQPGYGETTAGTPAQAPWWQQPPAAGGQGGYVPPPPSNWASPSSGWMPGGEPLGAPPAPPETKRGGLRKLTAVGVVAAILAAVAAAGIGIGRLTSSHDNQANGTEPIPKPAVTSGTAVTGRLDIAKVAAKIDPAIVDITSALSDGSGAAGTGMVLTSNGEVLTNNHVVEGATTISAQIDGKGPKYAVKVLGTDVVHDVALVQLIGASGLPTVTPGNSSTVTVGEPVVAIGNALALPGPPTVTNGIISALDRSITAGDPGGTSTEHLTGMLQTSAPINPGNSGGALVDASGHVIGMNTAAYTGSSTTSATNIGFAIPINEALSIASQIQQGHGSSTIQIGQRGYLGVEVESVAVAKQNGVGGGFGGVMPGTGYNPPVSSGAVVAGVVSGSGASSAGIVAGDVITGLDGHTIGTPSALSQYLIKDHPGTKVTVTWVNGSGTTHTASVTLQSGPVA